MMAIISGLQQQDRLLNALPFDKSQTSAAEARLPAARQTWDDPAVTVIV